MGIVSARGILIEMSNSVTSDGDSVDFGSGPYITSTTIYGFVADLVTLASCFAIFYAYLLSLAVSLKSADSCFFWAFSALFCSFCCCLINLSYSR